MIDLGGDVTICWRAKRKSKGIAVCLYWLYMFVRVVGCSDSQKGGSVGGSDGEEASGREEISAGEEASEGEEVLAKSVL